MTDTYRILGIDPGSRFTGFGVLDFEGDRASYVASGTIRSHDGSFPDRPPSSGQEATMRSIFSRCEVTGEIA